MMQNERRCKHLRAGFPVPASRKFKDQQRITVYPIRFAVESSFLTKSVGKFADYSKANGQAGIADSAPRTGWEAP
jgi:hypothetical protein